MISKELIPEKSLPRVYSIAFKMNVVAEIEAGKFTKEGARRHYQIKGKSCILNWIRNYGNLHQIQAQVKIVMQSEADDLQVLKKENEKLKKLLGASQLRESMWCTLVEVAEEKLGIEIKKKFGTMSSNNTINLQD